MDGKAFGARKAAVVRTLRHGYRPEWTQVAVTVADRERLRMFSVQHGCRSMVEAFHMLLDLAKVKGVESKASNGGSVAGLVATLKIKSNEYDGNKLAERVHNGEFDGFIKDYII